DLADSLRVGDGFVRTNADGLVTYASPNAMSAYRHLGLVGDLVGADLSAVTAGLVGDQPTDRGARGLLAVGAQGESEVENAAAALLLRVIPLLHDKQPAGSIVLLRDVTELRVRERELVSKEATIREIHHRVKNNLQTISSLLRLQGRRLPQGEGRVALAEAERRIRSIALVHEILSRDPSQQVPFNEIIEPLLRIAREAALTPEGVVAFSARGEPGQLPAELATPLAVVINELLQNAAEHAFPGDRAEAGPGRVVQVSLRNDGDELVVEVRDNGRGLPEGFSIEHTGTLGLSIVRDLVTGQLSGSIQMHTDGGTVVELRIPLHSDRPDHPGGLE
ncbi:MAG: sensor histidine kinase, partial [Nocardioidaceae bacterium]